MKKLRLLTLVLAVLAVDSAAVFAQERVTVVKRNSERVAGFFDDWVRATDTVYVRVSQNDQQRIGMGNILLIAAEGAANNLPATEIEAAHGPDHLLVTQNAEVLIGRLVNIEGGDGSAQPNERRSVTFRTTAGGERRFPFTEIRRIYLGNYPRATAAAPAPAPAPPPTAATAPTPVPEGSVRVPANQQWTATNIVIRRGDRVLFTPEGEIQLSGEADDKASANGSLKGRTAPNAPMPGVLAGALIGRIGNGAPFAIGNQSLPLPMSGDGPLWLGINDDAVGDNSGQLAVRVLVTRGR
jgi:hypothetical protein